MTTDISSLFGIELPIVQAPMAGAQNHHMAIAVANAGALGSIACSTISCDEIEQSVSAFRVHSNKPVNLNFFCHVHPARDEARELRWRDALSGIYATAGVQAESGGDVNVRTFNNKRCELVERLRPTVVSFHFGLPEKALLDRVRATGALIMSSATTRDEALFLQQHGCDAIIAQGSEAGGHRGMFLSDSTATQVGTFSLVQQIVSSVDVPVIAAGGVATGQAIAAAMQLGAAGVQIGTRFLKTPESTISNAHRELLLSDQPRASIITNVFTGRPARSLSNRLVEQVGPLSAEVPEYPYAIPAVSALRGAPDSATDYVSLWAGQSAMIGSAMSSAALVRELAEGAREHLSNTAGIAEKFS